MARYEVVVGGTRTVYRGSDRMMASSLYSEYVQRRMHTAVSKDGQVLMEAYGNARRSRATRMMEETTRAGYTRAVWHLRFNRSLLGWALTSARRAGGRVLHGRAIPKAVRDWALAEPSGPHGAWRGLYVVRDPDAIKVIEKAAGGRHSTSFVTDQIGKPRRTPRRDALVDVARRAVRHRRR